MNSDDGKFKVIKVTKLDDLLKEGAEIPESDVTFQTDKELIQLQHEEKKDDGKKYIIKPGCWSIEDGSFGTTLKKFELKEYDLLKTIDNTSMIFNEANKFFTRLHVYKRLKRKKRDPKRSILIASPAGVGKSAAITEVCRHYLQQKGTAVVYWDTSDVRSSAVNRFFLQRTKFHKSVERMIFVMEDIGGGTVEEYGGHKVADSSLLNLLDGVGRPFGGVPTFVVATTNNPEQAVAPLIDRPGRFDKVLEMKAPNKKECVELLKFIAEKDELSEEDKEAAEIASKHEFSIAHLQEMVDRSLLDDISILEAAKQLKKHKERVREAFQKEGKRMGIQ